jgi:LmbE family N-acetylglucosaminyl deacetylase
VLNLSFDPQKLATVLCLGAHCDDIEIGCGGTLMTLAARYPRAQFHWLVFASDEEREAETRAAAARIFAGGTRYHVDVLRFKGSYLPYQGAEVKDALEAARARLPAPELIFTHTLQDRHQDHRLIAELTWNTYRNQCVLEYEIPKYEGDLGQPNLFVPFGKEIVERKVRMLEECFASQRSRQWFDAGTFTGLMRLRGIECASPHGFAEGFHARKLTL